MYCVIETTEKNMQMVTLAPDSWYVNGKLYWPNVKDYEVRKLIRHKATPQENWKIFSEVKLLAANIGMKNNFIFFVYFT